MPVSVTTSVGEIDDIVVTVPGTTPPVLDRTPPQSAASAESGSGSDPDTAGDDNSAGTGQGDTKPDSKDNKSDDQGTQPQATGDGQPDQDDPNDPDAKLSDEEITAKLPENMKGLKKRFSTLTNRAKEAELKAQNAEQKALNLQRQVESTRIQQPVQPQAGNQPGTADTKPQTAVEKLGQFKAPHVLPNFENDKDAQGNAKWATYGEFLTAYQNVSNMNTTALMEYNGKLVVAAAEDAAAQARAAVKAETDAAKAREAAEKFVTELTVRMDASRKLHPDFDAIVMKNPNGIQVSPEVQFLIQTHEFGPELAYHLGNNPKIAADLFAKDPRMQLADAGVMLTNLTPKAKRNPTNGQFVPGNGTGNGTGAGNGRPKTPAKPLPRNAQTGSGGNQGVGIISYKTAGEMSPDDYVEARRAGRIK